ncbi:hypothetical protein QGN32_06530 [Mycolicibacterium sp. ND9-15]|uniref:hypothetical protein n=1 Tax=Mycolicibacterium sp. ND9-15 TaxID=3042320 RepID=UPI002DDA112C|nr:hypothetical protein [Mycolicibacterium sp. ND9-15]WSE57531.1 hypothetical protein QGN32_06530 [Mycolicibacterium sp. ND9-15]
MSSHSLIDPEFHPVTTLMLPDYPAASCSSKDTRIIYVHGERRMKTLHAEMVAAGISLEDQARRMASLRTALRLWTRTLMSDVEAARILQEHERNPTFEELLAKHEERGRVGAVAYEAIIVSCTKSRPSVDGAFEIDPDDPPPLPPV